MPEKKNGKFISFLTISGTLLGVIISIGIVYSAIECKVAKARDLIELKEFTTKIVNELRLVDSQISFRLDYKINKDRANYLDEQMMKMRQNHKFIRPETFPDPDRTIYMDMKREHDELMDKLRKSKGWPKG